MTIVEAMKTDYKIVLHNKNNDRVMCWDAGYGNWVVHDLVLDKPVCVDKSQHTAIDFLIGKR